MKDLALLGGNLRHPKVVDPVGKRKALFPPVMQDVALLPDEIVPVLAIDLDLLQNLGTAMESGIEGERQGLGGIGTSSGSVLSSEQSSGDASSTSPIRIGLGRLQGVVGVQTASASLTSGNISSLAALRRTPFSFTLNPRPAHTVGECTVSSNNAIPAAICARFSSTALHVVAPTSPIEAAASVSRRSALSALNAADQHSLSGQRRAGACVGLSLA